MIPGGKIFPEYFYRGYNIPKAIIPGVQISLDVLTRGGKEVCFTATPGYCNNVATMMHASDIDLDTQHGRGWRLILSSATRR